VSARATTSTPGVERRQNLPAQTHPAGIPAVTGIEEHAMRVCREQHGAPLIAEKKHVSPKFLPCVGIETGYRVSTLAPAT